MTGTTVLEAIDEAITFLEASGYTYGGDIHDNLVRAYDVIVKHGSFKHRYAQKCPVGKMELPEETEGIQKRKLR